MNFFKKVPHGRIDDDFESMSLLFDMERTGKSRKELDEDYDRAEYERKAEKEK